MAHFRLGFGPMSREIINAIGSYVSIYPEPLMIIASRNQVDYDSGYVMTTAALSNSLKTFDRTKILLCRDHCGPYFLDSEKGLSPRAAIEATKKTIGMDIAQGFDLIHIDTSRIRNGYQYAEELIAFSLTENPNIKFEFGTEENVGVTASSIRYKDDVYFAKQFPNMEFVVAQTGSLTYEDNQAGSFDINEVRKLVEIATTNNVKLKEHNADYLTPGQIELRRNAGVHALNIAPQLGVIQTRILRKFANNSTEWNDFSNVVLSSGKWEKWTTSNDNQKKVDVAGHYLYNSTEYKRLIEKLDPAWKIQLYTELHYIFNIYSNNL